MVLEGAAAWEEAELRGRQQSWEHSMEHRSRAEPEALLHRGRTEEAAETWKSPLSLSLSPSLPLFQQMSPLMTRASPHSVISKKASSVGVGSLYPSQ